MCRNLGTESVQYCGLFVALLILILRVLLTACIINCFNPDFVKSMKVEQFSPESGSELCFAVCPCRHLCAALICWDSRVGGRNMWCWQQPQAEWLLLFCSDGLAVSGDLMRCASLQSGRHLNTVAFCGFGAP